MGYTYTIKIGATTFTDMDKIVDSKTLKIVKPFCSTKKTSGTGTMSVTVKGAADTVYYKTFMMALLAAQQAQTVGDCEITVNDGSANVFCGYLDISTIQINSTKLPSDLNLSAKDKSILLDKKIRLNKAWEDEKRSKIISDLLEYYEDHDYQIPVTLLSNDLPATKKIKRWAVAEGKEQTYREVIDKILLESAGYVLWYDPANDGFRIKAIQTDLTGLTPRVVSYLVKNQLQTRSEIYDKDGVLLSFPNVVERPNTNIYTENINPSIDDNNNYIGQNIPAGHYFPADGDIKEVYQQYRVPDRPYLSHESRLQNQDLNLIYCKDVTYSIACEPSLDIAPAIPGVNWDGTPEYYPDRARLLFVNNNQSNYFLSEDTSADDGKEYYTYSNNHYTPVPSHTPADNPKANGWYEAKGANLTIFSLTGTAVYEDYLNKVTVGRLDPDGPNGAPCTNPLEYKADTIQYMNGDTDFSEALAFAKWYFKSLNYGQTISRWSEYDKQSYLGEVVYVAHKDTGIQMPHVVVQITDESVDGSRVRMNSIVAISIYGWEQYVYDNGISANGANGQQTQRANTISTGGLLVGETTCRGYAGIVGDIYINTDPDSPSYGNMYKCIQGGTAFSAIWQYEGNIKGKDATIEGSDFEIEYGLSDSPYEFHFPVSTYGYDSDNSYGKDASDSFGIENIGGWSSNYDSWYKGLYVWTRIKTTDQDGNIAYGEPTYANDITQSLINSCILDILLTDADNDGDSLTWEKNLAATTATVPLEFTIISRSSRSIADFKNTITSILIKFFKNGAELDPSTQIDLTSAVPTSETYESNTKTVRLTYSANFTKALDADSLSITVKIQDTYLKADNTPYTRDSMATKNMNAVDVTEYFAYGGVLSNVNNDDAEAIAYFTGRNSGIYQGFNYVDSTHNTIRYFNGVQWGVLSLTEDRAGTILSNVEADFWSLFQNTTESQKTNLWDMYGYKREIIAAAIASEKIVMYGDGVIASANISTDVSQDIDAEGFLTKTGYRLEGANGVLRAKEGYLKDIKIGGNATIGADAEVLGVLRNTDENGEVTFETVKDAGSMSIYTAGKLDSIDNPNAYSCKEWVDYIISFATNNLTDKTSYPITSCLLTKADGSSTTGISHIARLSSVSGAQTSTYQHTDVVVAETKRVFTNPYPCVVGLTGVTVAESRSYVSWSHNVTYGERSGYTIKVCYSDGTVYYSEGVGYSSWPQRTSGPDPVRSTSIASITVPPFGYVEVSWNALPINHGYNTNKGYVTWTYNESSYFPSAGVYLFSTSGYPYLITSYLKYSGFSTLNNTSIHISGFNAITLSFYANASWVVNKYYSFEWINAPLNQNIISTSLLASGSSFTYAGVSIVISTVRYSENYLEIIDLNGNSYVLTSGYIRQYSVTLNVIPGIIGMRAQNVMPVFDSNGRVGSGNVGTQDENWYIGWAQAGWQQGSKREIKENIISFDKNALDIIRSVDVVSYNLISDRGRKERYTHYGFIADDTAEELASPFHDRMDYGSCIGVLIKAVQELSAEITKLKGGNR